MFVQHDYSAVADKDRSLSVWIGCGAWFSINILGCESWFSPKIDNSEIFPEGFDAGRVRALKRNIQANNERIKETAYL